jgi:hypothetical protein
MHEGNSTLEGWVCAGGNNEQGKCGRYCTVQYRAGPGASGGTCNSNWRGGRTANSGIGSSIGSNRIAVPCGARVDVRPGRLALQ